MADADAKLRELSNLPVEVVGVTTSLRQYLYEKYTRLADGSVVTVAPPAPVYKDD